MSLPNKTKLFFGRKSDLVVIKGYIFIGNFNMILQAAYFVQNKIIVRRINDETS